MPTSTVVSTVHKLKDTGKPLLTTNNHASSEPRHIQAQNHPQTPHLPPPPPPNQRIFPLQTNPPHDRHSPRIQPPRLESAKIRVENTIRQDILVELLEILELYSELLLARIHMLEGTGPCDAGLEEAVKSLIYASQRVEVKELGMVRDLLAARFGKEFALQARENVGGGVSERVLRKLRVDTPSEELVGAYLKEIARTYGVDFGRDESSSPPPEGGEQGDDDDDSPSTGRKIPVAELEFADPKVGELVEDAKTPPRKVLPKSPIHVAPASPSSENPHPVVRMPGHGGGAGAGVQRQLQARAVVGKGLGGASGVEVVPAVQASGGKSKEDEVDDLLARFAALKKR
ncbi:regulator of Vps4 activity in the MVB pathway-domain-containing protein [Terfezia claveryi]|nr:regulator of Vps4 activity in the MVB pathway-domain-containing protein [Terfezia claveryi]